MVCGELMKKFIMSYGWDDKFCIVFEQIIGEEECKGNCVFVGFFCKFFDCFGEGVI